MRRGVWEGRFLWRGGRVVVVMVLLLLLLLLALSGSLLPFHASSLVGPSNLLACTVVAVAMPALPA
jgi:hypothetical protein